MSDNGDIKFFGRLSDVIPVKSWRTEWLHGSVHNEAEFELPGYAFGALGFVGLLRTWLHRIALNLPKEWQFWQIR